MHGQYQCSGCGEEYPIHSWGISFLRERPASPESQAEMDARNQKAREYEEYQLDHKRPSYWEMKKRLVRRMLRGIPEGPLLDAGCGTGLLTGMLSSTGRPVAAVDFSETSLQVLAEKEIPNVTAYHADLTAIPFADQTFGAIVSSMVVQHVPPPERVQVYQEFARCLAPGGMLILIAYNEAQFSGKGLPTVAVYENSGIPYYSFSHQGLRQEAEAVGFQGVTVRPLGLSFFLSSMRGGYRAYATLHPLLNKAEGFIHPFLPPNRGYPSNYWLMAATKP